MTLRPNIILLVLDTVRADRLSCYGYKRETTPYLDSLSKEGTLFEQAIAPAPWTLPSHVSMFTGLLPSKHGAHRDHHKFDTPYITLAQLLSQQGYQSVGFSNVQWVDDVTGAIRGFDEFYGRGIWRSPLPATDNLYSLRDKGAGRIIRGVREWVEGRGQENPFFMFINLLDAHNPYAPPDPYDKLFLSPSDVDRTSCINQDVLKYYVGEAKMAPEDFRILGDLYDGELRYLDMRVKELMEFLREKGMLDDTLLFITSDHGENLGEHGHFEHRYCLYEPVINVPLIIRYPGTFSSGVNVPDPVQTMDIYPTVMDILGIDREDIRRELQGESLVPSALSSRKRGFTISEWMPKPVLKRYDEYPDFDASVFAYGLKAIRYDRYKLVHATHGQHELYNLKDDPEEMVNLFNEDFNKAKELLEVLEGWEHGAMVASVPSYTLQKDMNIDEDVRSRLRELGYVD